MAFTDDDLRRLKEYGSDFKYTYSMIEALLARLETAERVITVGHNKSCWTAKGLACVCKWGDTVIAWRKAAGK